MPAAEGPLAHAVRTADEQAYVDGLAEGHREAWERASGATPEPASKRLLVHLSHSIERAVMSGPRVDPTVVIALFQRLPFFDRERAVYARMAEAGIHVVVGFVDGRAHDVPDGVHLVTLEPGEPLADEWTVVAAGPQAGAFLVATDQHARDPQESGTEAGRVFHGRWGYARAQAGSELARLRFALGDRLGPGIRRTIDELLARSMPAGGDPAASSGTTGEAWATTSLNHMIDRLLSARAGTRELRAQLADAQQAAAARAAAVVDPSSGLPTGDVLQRWAGAAGPETLPVGVALLDLPGLDRIGSDERAGYFAAHQVAAALTQPLGPVDTAARLSRREFALVLPGASERHLAGVCDRIGEQLGLASQGYPGVPLHGRVALMATRTRPLPLADLRAALGHLPEDPSGWGPVDTGSTPAGDRIVVAAIGTDETDATDGFAGPGIEDAAADHGRAGSGTDDGRPGTGPQSAVERSTGGAADPGSGYGFGGYGEEPTARPRPDAAADPVAPPPHAHAPEPQQAPPASRPRPYLDAGSDGHRGAGGTGFLDDVFADLSETRPGGHAGHDGGARNGHGLRRW